MFQPPEPIVKDIILNSLEGNKQTALHTFASEEDQFIILLNQAIEELKSIQTGNSFL